MTTKTTQRGCGCGCGTPTSGSATYRPGHDARHAGLVAREVLASGNTEALKGLSPALRTKAARMVSAAQAKQEAKAAKAAAKAQAKAESTKSVQPVKVGRWTYPAMRKGDVLLRNTKRDGSGEWVAA